MGDERETFSLVSGESGIEFTILREFRTFYSTFYVALNFIHTHKKDDARGVKLHEKFFYDE